MSASSVIRTAACAAVCGIALTGCASPGGGASTHNDVGRCAAVLPMARELVHSQGRLVVVRPLKQADADTIARDAGQPSTPSPPASGASPQPPQATQHPGTPAKPKLCLVVYEGSFRGESIPGAQPPSGTGRYALIFLRVRHPAVDRVLITDVLPPSSHRPWWHF
jgi:hypothetical protein